MKLVDLPSLHPHALGARVKGVYYTRDAYEKLRTESVSSQEAPVAVPPVILRQVIERLDSLNDEGPDGEGWQSDELRTLVEELRRLVEQ